MWKRSFIFTVRLYRPAFRKRSSNRRNLKTSAFRFRVDGRYFEDRAFRKQWRRDIHEISLIKFFSNTIQNDRRLLFQLSVDENYLMRFQSENVVFQFPAYMYWRCNPVKHGYHQDHQRVCCIWVTYVNQYRCGTPELNLVKILRISWPKRGHRRHLTSILAYFPGHCVQGRWKLKHNI